MPKFKRLIESRLLQEKQILFNHGANYNQAVFLAGGAGSGKSFAAKQFMEGQKFRTFDVDRWKKGFLELQRQTDRYPELRDLNLQNPEDVTKLHKFVKDKGIHNRFVNNVLLNTEPGRLPNVMFDTTLKDVDDLADFIPLLKETGYRSENIHLVWVLTDYEIAVERNRDRERIVPDDVLLQTHEGAASTIPGFVSEGLPRGMNGAVHVILNNPEHTVTFTDDEGEERLGTGSPVDLPGPLEKSDEDDDDWETSVVIKDFQYLTLKRAGEAFRDVLEIKETLAQWIRKNAPKTVKTWNQMSSLEQ